MNCNDVAAILDEHRKLKLTAAERSAVDQHLCGCDDCAAAWHAQGELLRLEVPAPPASLRAGVLASLSPLAAARPRRSRAPLIVGSVLIAGAALAAVTSVMVTETPNSLAPATATALPPATTTNATATDAPAPAAEPTAPAASDDGTSVELVETALSIVPLVRHGPDYPPSAREQRLEGHVQVRFDVTEAGVVENATVVESSDAIFEEPALEAVAKWRYLPRIAAGKRVGSTGIHTVLRFALGGGGAAPPAALPADPQRKGAQQEAARQYLAFTSDLEIALERLANDNLRGAELQLDEMQAIHGSHYPDLWKFYGYLYTVQGNYGRAIDAYETSVAAFAQVGQPASGPWVPLANLYFARHQYDMALKTLVTYRERIAQQQALYPGRPASPLETEAQRLVEQLRALGITDETLLRN